MNTSNRRPGGRHAATAAVALLLSVATAATAQTAAGPTADATPSPLPDGEALGWLARDLAGHCWQAGSAPGVRWCFGLGRWGVLYAVAHVGDADRQCQSWRRDPSFDGRVIQHSRPASMPPGIAGSAPVTIAYGRIRADRVDFGHPAPRYPEGVARTESLRSIDRDRFSYHYAGSYGPGGPRAGQETIPARDITFTRDPRRPAIGRPAGDCVDALEAIAEQQVRSGAGPAAQPASGAAGSRP